MAAKPRIRPSQSPAGANRFRDDGVDRPVLDVGRQAEGAEEQGQQDHQIGRCRQNEVDVQPRRFGSPSRFGSTRNHPANRRITPNTTSATETRRRIASCTASRARANTRRAKIAPCPPSPRRSGDKSCRRPSTSRAALPQRRTTRTAPRPPRLPAWLDSATAHRTTIRRKAGLKTL